MTIVPESSMSSRIRLLNVPGVAPGKCVVCGASSTDDRHYIDFGFDIDYYGVVYFCTLCMVEIANEMGYASPDQAQKAQMQILTLTDTLEVTTRERDAATNALRAYLNGGSNVGAVAEGQDLPKVVQPSKRPTPKKPETKRETSDPVSIPRSNDGDDISDSPISL